jgi:hypothetical protein
LRGAQRIELIHPASLSAAAAGEQWEDYLLSRKRRHTLWLVLNTLVSPVTVLFVPLPGPNVIGYWFVYRAICHLLARLGIRRVLSSEVSTSLVASSVLDGTLAAGDTERIAAVEAGFGLQGLGAYLDRATRARSGARVARLAAS